MIDAMGVDAEQTQEGPAAPQQEKQEQFKQQVQQAAPRTHPHGQTWKPGDAPAQALEWTVDAVANDYSHLPPPMPQA